jgi:hypothetical protein
MRNERRGPWYLLTGLILGIALGLVYAWLVSPVSYEDTPPIALRADYKDQYRTLIALAYASNGDLGRAKARLNLLGPEDPGPLVANQALRAAAEGRPPSEVQALALLAEVLGSPVEIVAPTPSPSPTAVPSATPSPSPTLAFTPTPLEPTPEAAATESAAPGTEPIGNPPPQAAAFTPRPALTPTETPGAPFVLREREEICDPALPDPLIQVFVFDASELPVPGAAVNISWPGGQERFFTGLKPEVGPGYADYQMDPETTYTLRLGDGGQTISDLQAQVCSNPGGARYFGSLRLTFVQP